MSTDALEIEVHSRADLLRAGLTSRGIDRELAAGRLIRLRRDHYVAVSHPDVDRAVRIGARISCVSLLALSGVFVFDSSVLHLQVARTASRLRSAHNRRKRWNRRDHKHENVLLHWADFTDSAESRHVASLQDAVRMAITCQSPRHAIATLDSALHLGVIEEQGLRDVFATLPTRYQTLLSLIDARCEAGTETLVRLILRQLGASIAIQPFVEDVGRVDFIVDGWLIIECDSKTYHDGWDAVRRDRRRDIAAARRGYTTIRLLAEDILYRPDEVRAALAAIIATRR